MPDLTKVGRYQIVDRVGRGGMGVVYRGYDPLLEREVAIKVMAGDFSGDEEARTRFYREAKAVARLQHRNIVTIFECGEEDGYPFFVMEFLRGSTLAERMRHAPPTSPQQLVDTLDILCQLCTGLQFAHSQGIIHRDVKPTNIWLTDDGTVKLLDFGIAKLAESTATRHGLVVGSAAYMSPEQVAGKPIDGRSDVFSAGVVLYELLSGRKPFEADTPTGVMMKILHEEAPAIDVVRPGLPPTVVSTVQKALKKDLHERFERAQDFGSALLIARRGLESGQMAAQDSVYLAETMLAESPYLRDKATVPGLPTVLVPGTVDRKPWLRKSAVAAAVIAATAVLTLLGLGIFGRNGSPQNSIAGVKPGSSTTAREPVVVSPLPSKPVIDNAHPFSGPQRLVAAPVAYGGTTPPIEPRRAARPLSQLATVTIEGEYPFEVVDGARVISQKSETHDLEVAAPRTLLLRAPEYLLAEIIKVEAGRDRVQRFTAPPLGKLTLRTPFETCTVMIGGRDFGFPPIVEQPLVARSYRVELKCPDGPGPSAVVVVSPGETRVRIVR